MAPARVTPHLSPVLLSRRPCQKACGRTRKVWRRSALNALARPTLRETSDLESPSAQQRLVK